MQAIHALNAAAAALLLEVNNALKSRHRMQSNRSIIQARERAQGNQSARHRLGAIGVQRGPGTAVTGVHGGQQVHHLRPAALPHNQAVRAHAQGLHDEFAQADSARPL